MPGMAPQHRMEKDQLFSHWTTRQERGYLQPWQYDTFKAHFRDRTIEDAFVTFTTKSKPATSITSQWLPFPRCRLQLRLPRPLFHPTKTTKVS